MKLVDRNDIETWAERVDSKFSLPILISRLVKASTPYSTIVDFPSGSAAFVGGWDGIVTCVENRGVVPDGISLWEFGTEADCKGKADDDYDSRTADSQGYTKSDCTFIFVTPRFWKQKGKWVTSKLKDNQWKDVRVYDSSIIEQWLGDAQAVARWFSSYVGKYPSDGIQTPHEFWEEWSRFESYTLQPKIVTAGREYEKGIIQTFLQSNPGIKAIKASTKNEAIAFIIATAKQFDIPELETFLSKSLIVNTEGNYRAIQTNALNPLNLIPRFDEKQAMYAAVSKGHHVLVPLGADEEFNQDIIILPPVDRDGQIDGLVQMGINIEKATQLSKEAGRNVTILKKLLKFPENKAKWFVEQDIREIIPALLLGRWNENSIGDRKLVEVVSNMPYDEYATVLLKWRDLEESPLIQIGETWRLTSPMDAWLNLSSHLTINDFENLNKCFLEAFQKGNPVVDESGKLILLPKFFKKETLYSNWSREGLVQSLILIGFYGERLKIHSLPSSQLWVDRLISELLQDATDEMWISLKHELPLIAEASPEGFLRAVENSLLSESKTIMKMFVEEDGLISTISNHPNLLWALEAIAWIPEYLLRVSTLLCKLAVYDPGGKLNNRPINSLLEIFKPWHFQTFATLNERLQVLKQLSKVDMEITWNLLIKLLPDPLGGIAQQTYKMRWRLFDYGKENKHTWEVLRDTNNAIVDLLLTIFDFSETKLSNLINESANLQYLGPENQNKILSFIEREAKNVEQVEYSPWNSIRKLLSHHRSHPDTVWALPESELLRYEKVYFQIQPSDEIKQKLWLFNEHWPDFPEGFNHKNDIVDKQQELIYEKRINFIREVYKNCGITKIKELAYTIKEPYILGNITANIIDNEEDIISLCEFLNENPPAINFIYAFIQRKGEILGLDWGISLFVDLKDKAYNNIALTNVLIPLKQSNRLWSFVDLSNTEIKNLYWKKIDPYFYQLDENELEIGFRNLIKHGRFLAAVHYCSQFIDKKLPTNLVIEILFKAATEKSEEVFYLRDYEIERIFMALDLRVDLEDSDFIQLELLYLEYLASHGSRRTPTRLHNAIVNKPDFFVELLTYLYKSDNLVEEESEVLTDMQKGNRAHRAYELLNSWEKIPGVSETGDIDKNILNEWVAQVLEKSESVGRRKFAEMEIGKVLAQYPEKNNSIWPPAEICEIIESINTDALKNNFRSAIFNKRGVYSKALFEGGKQEWALSAHFHQLSLRIINTYPSTASILESLAKGYEYDAKEEDKKAKREALEY